MQSSNGMAPRMNESVTTSFVKPWTSLSVEFAASSVRVMAM